MKKIIAVIILVAFIGAVAFASLTRANRTEKKKVQTEKNEKKIEKKKECRRTCLFS